MANKQLIGVDDFVAKLRSFEQSVITRDAVLDFCDSVQISDASLAPYVLFDDKFYTRNMIYRDDLFEVMTICWQPGQKTAVHTHNGQLCWMIPQRGNLGVVDYKWLGCDHPEHQNVVGIDCLAGSENTKLQVLHEIEACAGGPVMTADKLQTIHRLYNLSETTERAVSVHIYSRPIDSCVAFDMEGRRCYRRQLAYFSKYGELVPKPEPTAAPNAVPLVQLTR
ncbi:MAG: cysteine dioxygenase family protein [Acidobacteria bacterium]|nr:cysteine dioxygenase family protein [Acidobacteriota bacterium]